MAEETKAPLKTYRGNCHCGAYVFEAKMPEITKVHLCNCSICYKKAAAWSMPGQGNLTWVKGDPASMKGYTFGKKQFEHKFCETCGTSVAWFGYFSPPNEGEDRDPDVGLNLRCLQHGQIADIWDVEPVLFDGASMGAPYEPPTYTGPKPKMDIEGGKLYTGSCHCGAVTVAVNSKPLDKTFQEGVFECNCSGCIRAGGSFICPHKDAVAIDGEENTSSYTYGWPKAWEKYWCKTCGVLIGRRPLPMPDDVVASLSEETKKWTVDKRHLRPINLKIMNGVDFKDLSPTHFNGYDVITPMYSNP